LGGGNGRSNGTTTLEEKRKKNPRPRRKKLPGRGKPKEAHDISGSRKEEGKFFLRGDERTLQSEADQCWYETKLPAGGGRRLPSQGGKRPHGKKKPEKRESEGRGGKSRPEHEEKSKGAIFPEKAGGKEGGGKKRV